MPPGYVPIVVVTGSNSQPAKVGQSEKVYVTLSSPVAPGDSGLISLTIGVEDPANAQKVRYDEPAKNVPGGKRQVIFTVDILKPGKVTHVVELFNNGLEEDRASCRTVGTTNLRRAVPKKQHKRPALKKGAKKKK